MRVQLAGWWTETDSSYPVAVQPKHDGIRVWAVVADGRATLHTREGIVLDWPAVVAELATLPAGVYDGEAHAATFDRTLAQMTAHRDAVVTLFDRLADLDDRSPYSARLDALQVSLAGLSLRWLSVVQSAVAHSAADVQALYAAHLAAGHEGSVAKSLTAAYDFGGRNAMHKLKPVMDADLRIVGFAEGAGRLAGTLGALLCDFDGATVKVGAGLTDSQRRTVWRNQARYLGRVVQVEHVGVTASGSLRQPVFARFRGDKSA
jgi:DNA ligase-1